MSEQMRVKPSTSPILPATYTSPTASGDPNVSRIGAGIAGKNFDPRVSEHGDQWVMVNGPVQLAGVRPDGETVAIKADWDGHIATHQWPNITSTAYEASHMVKATGGILYGLSGYNSKASTQFILLLDYGYNIVPANGTIPVVIIAVSAASNFSYDPGTNGRTFSNGIWICNSSTGPTLTIGSADCWFDVQAM